jgi:hypothetical protein
MNMALFVFPLKSINGSNMYNNDDFRQYFANFISTGILANNPLAGSTAFQVTQTANPSMNVNVGGGVAWIIGGQVMNTSPLSFQIPAPLTSQSRTDSIVVQWSNSSNNGNIIYKQNSTQVVQTNDVYELQLCKILVPANATNIPQANITDMRADTSVCGFSSPYEEIRTGDLLAQFKSELEENDIIFSEWFDHIKGQLSDDAAGNLQNQVDSLKTETDSILSKVYPIGAYYFSSQPTEPATLFGFGTWLRVKGRGLVGVDESDSALSSGGKQGGSINPLSQHTIAPSNGQFVVARGAGNQHWSSGGAPSNSYAMDTENGGITVGDNTNHNNWQPFEAAYIWKRTA